MSKNESILKPMRGLRYFSLGGVTQHNSKTGASKATYKFISDVAIVCAIKTIEHWAEMSEKEQFEYHMSERLLCRLIVDESGHTVEELASDGGFDIVKATFCSLAGKVYELTVDPYSWYFVKVYRANEEDYRGKEIINLDNVDAVLVTERDGDYNHAGVVIADYVNFEEDPNPDGLSNKLTAREICNSSFVFRDIELDADVVMNTDFHHCRVISKRPCLFVNCVFVGATDLENRDNFTFCECRFNCPELNIK